MPSKNRLLFKFMQYKGQFDYLEDGQTAPRISMWQERLSESCETVLSVFSDAVQKSSVKAISKRLDEIELVLQKELNELCAAVSKYTSRMPLPQGFFVSDAERVPTYRSVCLILQSVEAHMRCFRAMSLSLADLKDSYAAARRSTADASQLLFEIKEAAKKNHKSNISDLISEQDAQLQANIANAKVLRERLSSLEGALCYLCTDILPNFCNRMEKAADMEHEGASCNPVTAVRLCGELEAALGSLNGG